MGEMNQNAIWPGWETVKVIGAGSFGTVYEIQRNVFGATEHAALKMISIPHDPSEIEELYNEGYDNDNITAHFKDCLEDIIREYSLMLEIRGHSNVVYCEDIQYTPQADGIGWNIFIKMELLTPLTKWVGHTYDEKQVVKLGIDICRALQLCRQKKIVHRDIKPHNIFISPSGDFKLGDFGVAKVSEKTTGGTKIGTYEYMAPEVYNNRPYGTAADLYSLGIVLYWMMNNRRGPFLPAPPTIPSGIVKEEAYQRRFSGEPLPPPANGSQELQQIVQTACAFDPKKRYRSPEDMLTDLISLRSKLESGSKVPDPLTAPTRTYVIQRIRDAILANFYQQKGIDLRSNPSAMTRINKACADTYAALQKKHTVSISLPKIVSNSTGPLDLAVTLSREAVAYDISAYDALIEQTLFDHMVNYCRTTFQEDPRNNLLSVVRIWLAAERARTDLYKLDTVTIHIKDLVRTSAGLQDMHLSVSLEALISNEAEISHTGTTALGHSTNDTSNKTHITTCDTAKDAMSNSVTDAAAHSTSGTTENTAKNTTSSTMPSDPTIRLTLPITLEEAATGCEKELQLRRREVCRSCGGHDVSCPTCHGNGTILVRRKLLATVPGGIDNNQILRLAKQGHAIHGTVGDLLVTVQLKPHAAFTKQGNDVHSTIYVTRRSIQTGAAIQIATLYGTISYRLPTDTHSGEQFVITGYGFPKLGSPKQKGNHCFTVMIRQ